MWGTLVWCDVGWRVRGASKHQHSSARLIRLGCQPAAREAGVRTMAVCIVHHQRAAKGSALQ